MNKLCAIRPISVYYIHLHPSTSMCHVMFHLNLTYLGVKKRAMLQVSKSKRVKRVGPGSQLRARPVEMRGKEAPVKLTRCPVDVVRFREMVALAHQATDASDSTLFECREITWCCEHFFELRLKGLPKDDLPISHWNRANAGQHVLV